MTEDKEIREAVRILKEIQNPCGIKGNYETIASKNVSVLLALAERYLQVGEMLPRKSCTCNDPSCEGYVRNKVIEDCRLAYTKQMTERLDIEAIENIILLYASEHPHRDWSIGIKGYDDVPMKKRRKENLEHWRACATAIRNHIANVSKTIGEGNGKNRIL